MFVYSAISLLNIWQLGSVNAIENISYSSPKRLRDIALYISSQYERWMNDVLLWLSNYDTMKKNTNHPNNIQPLNTLNWLWPYIFELILLCIYTSGRFTPFFLSFTYVQVFCFCSTSFFSSSFQSICPPLQVLFLLLLLSLQITMASGNTIVSHRLFLPVHHHYAQIGAQSWTLM